MIHTNGANDKAWAYQADLEPETHLIIKNLKYIFLFNFNNSLFRFAWTTENISWLDPVFWVKIDFWNRWYLIKLDYHVYIKSRINQGVSHIKKRK